MDKIKPQIRPIKENEVMLRDNVDWLHFMNPYRIIIAERLDDVLPALQEIEHQVQGRDQYAAGFISYEAAPGFDSALQVQSESEFPYLWFGLYPEPHVIELPNPAGSQEELDWQPTTDCESYQTAITKIKEHIGEGRTYQVNYTMRLQADFTGDPWELFLQLAKFQNRHAAFIDIGQYAICSASPELFFQLDGNTITCRPMKGTTSRGRTTTEDRQQSEWLRNSAKNRAENVMIVDMIRNDLGRIAKGGSVSVPQLFEPERYPTLWQMTSTVSAKTDVSIPEIFTALFPCASITGAPKVSTMNIIAELEDTPRKIYTGTIGYLAPQRKARFNVAIRTALIDRGRKRMEYGVGGGIVWDSVSGEEYAEALLKANVLTEPQPRFSLFETMLWTPKEKFFLHDKHVARMLDSADHFGIPLKKDDLETFLHQVAYSFRTPQRLRVLLDQKGDLEAESRSFNPLENRQMLKVHLAKEPVHSSNVFLFHKTTQRAVHDAARQGYEDLDDVLLYNEKGELTEFTIGNLVVEFEGQLLTPPVSCGVLAGTFRAQLLETGQVVEKIVLVEHLGDCTKVFRINSIRRWQSVEIKS
jgi:para-aminobenzoate synthetase/4-amino-4-deoxychorismate lyase